MAIEFISQLLEKSDVSGSKSTILKPITWFITFLVAGLLASLRFQAPEYVVIFFMVLIGLAVSVFLLAFGYCLFKDRDALRSEKFSIQKMAIEKGIYGDNSSGVFMIQARQDLEKLEAKINSMNDDNDNRE